MRVVWLFNRYPKVDNPERVKNKNHKIESALFLSGLSIQSVQRRKEETLPGSGVWAQEKSQAGKRGEAYRREGKDTGVCRWI